MIFDYTNPITNYKYLENRYVIFKNATSKILNTYKIHDKFMLNLLCFIILRNILLKLSLTSTLFLICPSFNFSNERLIIVTDILIYVRISPYNKK